MQSPTKTETLHSDRWSAQCGYGEKLALPRRERSELRVTACVRPASPTTLTPAAAQPDRPARARLPAHASGCSLAPRSIVGGHRLSAELSESCQFPESQQPRTICNSMLCSVATTRWCRRPSTEESSAAFEIRTRLGREQWSRQPLRDRLNAPRRVHQWDHADGVEARQQTRGRTSRHRKVRDSDHKCVHYGKRP